MNIKDSLEAVRGELPEGVELVAVSKTMPADAVMEAYEAGQRVFGENRPQEMAAKREALPKDIQWHMIGNLQTNKVKYIAPFVAMIQSVDSARLLEAINREGQKNGRIIDVLLELHIAKEESKHGWEEDELKAYLSSGDHKTLPYVRLRGVMGMATFTGDEGVVRAEFADLKRVFDQVKAAFLGKDFDTLSMGMTSDFGIALQEGSNMVRIGSRIFGERPARHKP